MNSNIPFSQIKAVIFDMDELMVDSATPHRIAFEKVMNSYGVSLFDPKDPYPLEEEATWYGLKVVDIFEELRKRYNLEDKTTAEEMNKRFNEFLFPTYEKDVPVMDGVVELITYLKGKYKQSLRSYALKQSLRSGDLKLAIASSAKKKKIDIVRRKLNVMDAFDVIVSGEDEIKHGKPAPDIYLETAKRLGIDPANCLVLEDAKHGITAAKAAGMFCIGVHNKYTFKRLGIRQDLSVADREVESLVEVLDIFKQNQQ